MSESARLRVLYLTWGEVPRSYGIYGSQVVEFVKALQDCDEVEDIKLVAGYPLLHSGMVREGRAYRQVLENLRQRVGTSNLVTRRLAVPPIGIYARPLELRLFVKGHLRWGSRLIKDFQPDVVHCRGYVAAYFAHELRDFMDGSFAIAFDPRSRLPEEGVVRGSWGESSKTFHFWKQLEFRLLSESHAVSAVSATMQRALEEAGAPKCELLHTCVSFRQDEPLAPAKESSASDALSLCYAGHLAPGSWHEPTELWDIFRRICELRPNSTLAVITNTSESVLRPHLRASLCPDLASKVSFTRANSSAETVRLLSRFDAGILSYHSPAVGAAAQSCADSVFATKTAEYLSAGIPAIVNEVCGGAREFIVEHRVGIAYGSVALLESDIAEIERLSRMPELIQGLARQHFDMAVNAKRWVEIYESIRT